MKRVLLLNYEFPPLGGGAANATYFLLKEFAKQNNLSIDLITSSVDKAKKENFAENIKIHYLDISKNGALHYQSNKDLLLYSWKAYWQAKKLIKEAHYDLVHAFFGIPCGFIALLLGKPYIVSLRGSDVPFYNARFKNLDKYFFQYLSRFIWKKAGSVTANSQGLKELALKTAPQQKIKVIPNGVDTDFFKPDKRIKKKNVILFVGRLIKRKGLKYLIEAFEKLDGKLKKDWQLWIAGTGPSLDKLKAKSEELNRMFTEGNHAILSSEQGCGLERSKNFKRRAVMSLWREAEPCRIAWLSLNSIKFLGRKNKKQLQKIYNQAQVFALPSLNEGMSNTILEAMACALPIITADTGGVEELINKENGIVVEKKSVEELKKALESLLRDEKKRVKMGLAGRKKAEAFSWQNTAQEYLKTYTAPRPPCNFSLFNSYNS